MTLNEFIKKYEGNSVGYPLGSFVGECLSLAKWYVKDCFNIDPPASGSGSAYGYWSNFPSPLGTVFEKITNTDTSYPLPGDIVIWQPWSTNQYGHIAICLSGDVNSFVSLDQNWGTKNAKRITHDYKNVAGYLRSIIKPVNNSDPTMTSQETTMLQFIRDNKITEGQLRQGQGYISDNIEKTVNDLKIQINELQSSVDSLTQQLSVVSKDGLDWQVRYETANTSLTSANNSNIILKRQVDDLTQQIEKLQLPKNPWELIVTGIKSLLKK